VSRPALARVLWFGLGLLASPLAARAQDLDAGKTPAQLFSSHCSACHRAPQGLAKRTFGLTGFLRQHYTSSAATASALAAYVAAAGPDPRAARDAQRGGRQPPPHAQRGGGQLLPPAPIPDGGDPRIQREPVTAPAASAQPPPEPPKPRRDPRLAVAVKHDPQPFLILPDPIPVPPDPTSWRTPPALPAPSELRPTLPDTTATTAPAPGAIRPTTTTAELSGGGAAPPVPGARGNASADQPTFAAPLP
jgi:hypothetical protein